MKALPLLLAALFFGGCDMKKITTVEEPGTNNSLPDSGASPVRPAATPTPKPKPGEWMLKDYKNPLDPPKR